MSDTDDLLDELELQAHERKDEEYYQKGKAIAIKLGWKFTRFKNFAYRVFKDYDISEDDVVEWYKDYCILRSVYAESVRQWMYDKRRIIEEKN